MWREEDVIAAVRADPDMPEVEKIYKYEGTGVVGIVVNGIETCITGIDPENLPTAAARQICRKWIYG
jgi:hypothetical protein